MAIKAGRVGVNPAHVDELGNVKGGGLTPEERAKLEKALVTPVTVPTEKELVGVGTANEQIMFKIGDGLSVDGETSPFTLKASGGAGFTKVWENESKHTMFNSQTIAVDLTGYAHVLIEFNSAGGVTNTQEAMFPIGTDKCTLSTLYKSATGFVLGARDFEFTSSGILFQAGYFTEITNSTPVAPAVWNLVCVPNKIYAI